MNPYQKRCENCKWWDGKRYEKVNITRRCKRYPKYEDRKFNDWCGEYTSVLGRK